MRVVCVCACHRSSTVGWLKASQLPRVQRSPCRSSARVSAQSEFIINGQKHEYPVTNDHAKIVDGRTYLKLCRRSTVVRRMLAVQVDVDCSRNDPMWVLARSNVIDMIAELRFRKMKDHVLDSAQGKREFWSPRPPWASRTICGPEGPQMCGTSSGRIQRSSAPSLHCLIRSRSGARSMVWMLFR